jgi:hypothetical protein
MMLARLAFLAAIAVRAVLAFPRPGAASAGHQKCPPFSGNFTINQYQLYPENVDFDTDNCLLYLGCISPLPNLMPSKLTFVQIDASGMQQ